MTENIWRTVAEVTLTDEARANQAPLESLITSVAELHREPVFLEQVQVAVSETIGRASQRSQAASVTVTAHVLQLADGQVGHSWGFFLIEKRAQEPAHRRIAVLLYLESR